MIDWLNSVYQALPGGDLWGILELVSVISLTLYVFLAMYEKIWAWPASIVGVVIYIVLMARGALWGEVGLNVYYLAIAIYAWIHWQHGGQGHTELRVGRIPLFEAGLCVLFTVLAIPTLAWVLGMLRGSVPWLDATTNVMSIVATWMVARKYLEAWALWVVTDAVYIYLMHVREYHFYTLLYIIYTVVALAAFVRWLRVYQRGDRDALPGGPGG